MDQQAIFKLTYGLFVLGTAVEGQKNACIINTAQQVTAIPEKISITVAKNNLTHDMVKESKQFSVSILGENMDLDIINHFGMQSGRDVNKFETISYKEDSLGNPYIEEGVVAVLSGRVLQEVDLGTHTLFIADLVDSKLLSDEQPITYGGYREKRMNAGKSNQVETKSQDIYECTICHYEYEGEIPFEELPEDYVCPICKQPKSVFIKK